MDGLFDGPASERRRFLDRLVLAVDAEHARPRERAGASLRSRNRLLEDRAPIRTGSTRSSTRPRSWRSRSRRAGETVGRLQAALAARRGHGLAVPGRRDRARRLDGDDACRIILPSRSRTAIARCSGTIAPRDAAAGRTLDGPHSDRSRRGPYAARASPPPTLDRRAEGAADRPGLAHAGLIAEMTGFRALLLDEVVAHLDPPRRAALYAELDSSSAGDPG